ncbi:MAG: RNA polymerase factor sigma-54 [Acetobacteraceae bacterium]|nr:RNA polymerase factor sigma-54 [Acetobacteraceae bacterium]
MSIAPRLDLRQTQTLVITPQLRQAIKLLQYSNLEVSAFVENELERNPLLERDERGDAPPPELAALDQLGATTKPSADTATLAREATLPSPENTPLDSDHGETYDPGGPSDGVNREYRRSAGADEGDDPGIENRAEARLSLREHLSEQLRLSFSDPSERIIGAYLIALLCPAGRLTAHPASIAQALGVGLERVEAVRARMMRFEPVGLFARDLKECLSVQLAERDRLDPAMQALLDNLELLARRDLRQLMLLCGVDAEDLSGMIAEVRALDPKPGAGWDAAPVQTLVPDLVMRPKAEGGWIVELNPETLPRVLVNHRFYARIIPGAPREQKTFLTEQMQNANWLVKSLEQRAQTILKVASEIISQQDGFFRHGVSHLRPLILRDIAESVEMHESTVSRVTSNKYIATPRGIFELKYFFSPAIGGTSSGENYSAEAIRYRIRALISAETPQHVLSDDAIVAALRSEGVDIARRTVAKYREALRIPSSVQRKREKAVPA